MTNHFPSCPSRPPKFVIHFRSSTNLLVGIQGFCTELAAKGFIDEVSRRVSGLAPRWLSSTKLQLNYDLIVESPHLEDIMETSGTMSMPYPYSSSASEIAGNGPEAFNGSTPMIEDTPTRKRRERRSDAETRSERPKRQRPEGSLVNAADLAMRVKLDPSKLRRILRTLGTAKPYEWSEGPELEALIAQINKEKK